MTDDDPQPEHHDESCNAFEIGSWDPDCARCRWFHRHPPTRHMANLLDTRPLT